MYQEGHTTFRGDLHLDPSSRPSQATPSVMQDLITSGVLFLIGAAAYFIQDFILYLFKNPKNS